MDMQWAHAAGRWQIECRERGEGAFRVRCDFVYAVGNEVMDRAVDNRPIGLHEIIGKGERIPRFA